MLLGSLWACGAPREGPPPGQVELPAGFALEHVPGRFERRADLHGPPPWGFVETSSIADLELDLEDPGDEPELFGDRHGPVKPILAMTGTVTFDIPMSDDERVGEWVNHLQGRGSAWFAKWLSRSTRYVPLFWEILEQYGLPKDLVFLSMIESGFSPKAYSWAHAAGAWQFMPATGRQYGLRVEFWVDERRDFVKATHAAARHLRDLHDYFGDWHLAWAAYNAGTGRMNKAIRGSGTNDYWRIARTWHIRRETAHYVPKLLAAAIVSKQPEKFGFGAVEYLPPLAWEILTVTVATDLKTLASACGLEHHEELDLLNPALRVGVTPPGEAWEVRVPPGMAEPCRAGLEAMAPEVRLTFRYHELSPGESLATLAKRYRTTPEAILAFHEIEAAQLEDFSELAVPVPLAVAAEVPIRAPPFRPLRTGKYGPDGGQVRIHVVRPGESLWTIARRYGVSLQKLRLWNGLWKKTSLRAGQQVRIYGGRAEPRPEAQAARPGAASKAPQSHRVRSGESLWSIAQRYGTTVERLAAANKLGKNAALQVGQVLRIQ